MFLYGDSGSGKSSLVNAGLLPQALAMDFAPLRVRVQPRAGEELVVERIARSDDAGDALPIVLAGEDEEAARVVLSIAEFEARVRAAAQTERPLIVFDQFEEILTLFEDDDAVASRVALAEMIARLLRDPLPVKLLFAFREDYLGRVKQLLDARPELVDQALRLGPPSAGRSPRSSAAPSSASRAPTSTSSGRRSASACEPRSKSALAAATSACRRCRPSACGSGGHPTPTACSPRRASRGCSKTSLARRSTASRPTCARPRSRCSAR